MRLLRSNMKKSFVFIEYFVLPILLFCSTYIAAEHTIYVFDNSEALGSACARQIADCIVANNAQQKSTVLGLATGSSPLSTYEALKCIIKKENIDLSRVITFNLDEYVGLPLDHVQSYHHFMWTHLFNAIVQSEHNPNGIDPKNIHLPNGYAKKEEDLSFKERDALMAAFQQRIVGTPLSKEEEHWILNQRIISYEALIKEQGPIDLQILGIGINGHIGFAEPGSAFDGNTMITQLTESTRLANARFFKNESDVPTQALTMGIGTILQAKKIILLALGKSKADIVATTLEGEFSSTIPAMALRLHPDVCYCLDCDAGSCLKNRQQ